MTAQDVRVLVVDDNFLSCRALARLLAESGYPAHCIDSGAKAVAFLRDCSPRLVFLDVMMPGMDGFEVLKAIRANDKCDDVVVVMYSAVSDIELQRKAIRLGANRFIVKGRFSYDELEKIVAQHVQRGD